MHFSTSQLKVVRSWCVLYILTWKCASQQPRAIFISHLASWLRTRRFSEPAFRPLEPQIIGKTQWIATFLAFRASASSFFLLFHFYPSFFNLSLLSASSLLCFSSVHIVGSLTSKLPSIICHNNLYNIKNSIYFWLELSGESPQCSTMEPDSWFPIRFVIFVGGGCFHAIRFGGSLAIREPREGLA